MRLVVHPGWYARFPEGRHHLLEPEDSLDPEDDPLESNTPPEEDERSWFQLSLDERLTALGV